MTKSINYTGAISLLQKIHLNLRNKERTPEENEIFNLIENEYGNAFRNSLSLYYQEHKDIAQVSFSGFYSRIKDGWTKQDAISTPKLKQNSYKENKQKGKTLKQIRKEEFEADIINMLKNAVPLSRRQRKYVEENTEFAKRLRNGV